MKETTENKGEFVAYYRVSTESQGRSGLGLEAQKKAVLDFLNGGQWELVAEFTEIETGKKAHTANRPELEHALKLCKKTRATLVRRKKPGAPRPSSNRLGEIVPHAVFRRSLPVAFGTFIFPVRVVLSHRLPV